MKKSVLISKSYNKKDKYLVHYIRDLYKTVFNIIDDELMPPILKIQENELKLLRVIPYKVLVAKNPPSCQLFDKELWRNRIGSNVILHQRIWRIICIICDYQTNHLDKRDFFTANHRGDPSILVLEAIKEDLVDISKGDILQFVEYSKPNSKLDKIICFLGRLEVSDQFPQSSGKNNITRMEVFIKTRIELENLLDDIILYLKNSCAYEDMKVVIENGRKLLGLGIDCVHYVLRNQFTLQDSSIETLRNPRSNIEINQMRCYLGQLLQQLLNSPVFLILYPDQNKSLQIDILNPPVLFSVVENQVESREDLQEWINMLLKSRQTLSGIQEGCVNLAIIKNFILLHGFLEELGRCLVACERAFSSAKDGGDLLVYGLINRPVAEVASNTIYYISKTCAAFQELHRSLDEYYYNFATNKELKNVSDWLKNFNSSKKSFRNFSSLADDCALALGKVQAKAHQGLDADRMGNIINNIKSLVLINDSISTRKGGESCIKDLPFKLKQLIGLLPELPLVQLVSPQRVELLESSEGQSLRLEPPSQKGNRRNSIFRSVSSSNRQPRQVAASLDRGNNIIPKAPERQNKGSVLSRLRRYSSPSIKIPPKDKDEDLGNGNAKK